MRGDYALDITMDESGDGGEVKWYDAATGEEGTPTPDELAGKNAPTYNVVVTPDGKYLAFSADFDDGLVTHSYILDVASGTITRIDSEIELTPWSMTATTLYATGEGGAAVVDLPTGEATAMESGTAPDAVNERFGLFWASDTVVVAPKT